jgi:peptide deformylase
MKKLTLIALLLGSFQTLAQTRLEVIQIGHPTLRAQAKEVDLNAAANPVFQTLIDNMIFTMKKASGVGLAAPQVNESIRMFVMKSGFQVPLTVVINPTIEYLTEFGKQDSVEGCLSIPGQTLKVQRYKRIRMSYYDRDGKYIAEEVKGFKAIISQHEYDHLNGVLIVDLVQQMFTEMDYENYVNAPLM